MSNPLKDDLILDMYEWLETTCDEVETILWSDPVLRPRIEEIRERRYQRSREFFDAVQRRRAGAGAKMAGDERFGGPAHLL